MDNKVFIRIKDKETGYESNEVTIEDLIFNQHDIEFEFLEDGGSLPYKDFLFYQEGYEVIVRVGEMDKKQDAIDKTMVSAILFKYKVPVDEVKLIGAFIERLEKERDEYKEDAWKYKELCK